MGKKPVLGMVSALCVGLALTGCRDPNTRADGSLTKSNGPTYKAPAAWSMNPSNTTNTGAPVTTWNNPPPADKNAAWTGGAPSNTPPTPGATLTNGMKPTDALNTSHMPPTTQTIGTTAPPAPPPASGYDDLAPAGASVQPPAGDSRLSPPSRNIYDVNSGPPGRVLMPPPSFTSGSAANPASASDLPPAPPTPPHAPGTPPTADGPMLATPPTASHAPEPPPTADGPMLATPPVSSAPPLDPTPPARAMPTPQPPPDLPAPTAPLPPLSVPPLPGPPPNG